MCLRLKIRLVGLSLESLSKNADFVMQVRKFREISSFGPLSFVEIQSKSMGKFASLGLRA